MAKHHNVFSTIFEATFKYKGHKHTLVHRLKWTITAFGRNALNKACKTADQN